MAQQQRTTEDNLTDEQKAKRDAQLAAARTMTDAELAEFTRRGEAAWQRYENAE